MATIHVFDYLEAPPQLPPGVCVVFGDEPFLKQLALTQLRNSLLPDPDSPFATFDGGQVQWRDVSDELSTIAMFGGGAKRVAIVEQADSFVSQDRDRLQDYVTKPRSKAALILEVKSWAATTNLYKTLDKTGLQIDCRAPQQTTGRKEIDIRRISAWLIDWAQKRHDAKLTAAGANLLLDLVGPEFGLLDQELAKLALFAGLGGTIKPDMVRDVVGGWKMKTIWELMDSANDGKAADALFQLDRILQSGQEPIASFGPISWSLRRFAAATRIYQRAEREGRRMTLTAALTEAGFRAWPKSALPNAERQLKQMGRERAGHIYRWLLDIDLALKGSHSASARARWALESLILRLAKESGESRS